MYATTKAVVGQFSDTLRRELYQYPLHVKRVRPAATDTDMMKSAVVHYLDLAEYVNRPTVQGVLKQLINFIGCEGAGKDEFPGAEND